MLETRARGQASFWLASGPLHLVGESFFNQKTDKIVARAKVPVIIETDPAKMRPVDEPILVGDNSLLRKHTGWAPKISVDGIIDDVLEFWREQIAFYGINKV